MKTNKIINGNSLEILKQIEDNSVDLIFADPPYWMRVDGVLNRFEGTEFKGCNDDWDNQFNTQLDYEIFTQKWLSECYRVLKKNGSIWVIGGMQCIYTIGGIMQKIGYWFINDVIWHKTNPTPNFNGTRLNNSHETLIWATKSKSSRYTFNYKTAKEHNKDTVLKTDYEKGIRKQLGSVWKIGICQGKERLKDDKGQKLHSTQKPEELLYRIITISSKLDDVILDPFAGTMTTGVVAKKTGRNYIMIEQNKNYISYGEQRIKNTKTNITEIEQAKFDQKPPKVDVKDMIKNKYLIENELFYLKNGKETAMLKKDAKLEYKTEIIDMNTCAALALGRKAKRLNGFDYWYVVRNGELLRIKEIRNQYRKQILGYES